MVAHYADIAMRPEADALQQATLETAWVTVSSLC